MSDSDQPGQESHRTPDFIPGWFAKRSDGEIREAVRWVGGHDFPVAFLRSDEAVKPARPPQRGISIHPIPTDPNNTSLAIPPMYWVVRDGRGKLALYSDFDFKRGWLRENDREWTPPASREPDSDPHGKHGKGPRFLRSVRDRVRANEEAERNLERSSPRREKTSERLAVSDQTIDERTDEKGRPNRPPQTPEEAAEEAGHIYPKGSPERRLVEMEADAAKVTREIAEGAGWQGTEPAPGTRRRIVFEALAEFFRAYEADKSTSDSWALAGADAVESALLQTTIDEEAKARGAEVLSDGIVEVSPSMAGVERELKEKAEALLREKREEAAEAHCILDAFNVPKGPEISPPTVLNRLRELRAMRIEAQEAIDRVGEVLDAIDAPQAPTFADRIQRLYRELKDRLDQAPFAETAAERRLKVDIGRVHNLLDAWDIPRNGPDDNDLDPSPEEARKPFTLYQRVLELTDRLRRAEGRPFNPAKTAFAAPAGKVPEGTTELRVVMKDRAREGHPPDYHFIELEDQRGRGVGGFDWVEDGEYKVLVIPYARDDEWVQRVAMAAITAGQEADRPFPAEALDDVLAEHGVQPTFPRDWPSRGDQSEPESYTEAHDLELSDEAVDKVVEAIATDDGDEDGWAWGRRMHNEREEARAGESRFAEERDCAYALLRWLLPVRVATRVDDPREED